MEEKEYPMSYSAFKNKARAHQVLFREKVLCVDYHIYPNVLKPNDAKKGLIFFEAFRTDILEELKKPIPATSSAPSGQMLTNLLRSEHIPYNIFFPMKYDLDGCKNIFNEIFGREKIIEISDINIEYHPEPIEDYLSDHTAFDVYISYLDSNNSPCGIGIEVKYTEKDYPLKEGSREYNHVKDEFGATRLFQNYYNATVNSNYYKEDVSHDKLVSNKFCQIWRNHILGASMVQHGDIKDFTSITLFPEANFHFNIDALPKYQELLTDEGYKTFIPLTYERLFKLMEKHLKIDTTEEWMKYLRHRYLF